MANITAKSQILAGCLRGGGCCNDLAAKGVTASSYKPPLQDKLQAFRYFAAPGSPQN